MPQHSTTQNKISTHLTIVEEKISGRCKENKGKKKKERAQSNELTF
jgi:hypothetical protein